MLCPWFDDIANTRRQVRQDLRYLIFNHGCLCTAGESGRKMREPNFAPKLFLDVGTMFFTESKFLWTETSSSSTMIRK